MINPSPTEIKAWRESVGLTQAQAAKPLILQADKPHFERLLSQFLPLLFA